MSITNYQLPDFINITEILANFTNAGPNLGTPPNATYAGLAAAAYGPSNVQSHNADTVSAAVIYSYDLDHSTPTNPIPTNAQITKITVQLQITTNEVTAFMDGNFVTDHANTGRAVAAAQASIDIRPLSVFNTPPPDVLSWITSPVAPYLVGVISDVDTTAYGATASATANGTAIALAQVIFDIATNPGGDFPLGYMDYTTFVAQFTNWFTSFSHSASGSVNWFGIINGVDAVDGTFSNGIDFAASNLTIIVEWTAPVVTNWAIQDDTFTLPADDVITLLNSAGDEPLTKVIIGETEITPDDPWVIIWTKVEIKIHFPPDAVKRRQDPPRVDIEGTTFSGSVPLGLLTITEVDLSGIYQLDIDAHTDTLYARDTTSTTYEVAIPAPFFVTYFVDHKETDVCHFTGTRMRVIGNGQIFQVFQSLDYINTEEFGNLILASANNLSPFALANFIDQQASLRVYTEEIEAFMNVSSIVIFWKQLYTGYPQ